MRAFSGVQPSGIIHIGNYFGAIKNWVELQEKHECIFCIVNQHALTLPQKPPELKENTFKVAATYLAAGIDPEKSIIFIQSQVPEHTELCWVLNTITHIPELERMTQFKEKSKEYRKEVNVGLFNYPVLMAADILLYQTDIVPVGEDQKQHIELTQVLARRFNRNFGQAFKIPQSLIKKESGRIMGLDNPLKKMSKSSKSSLNYISLDDSPELIREKIKKAVTDSGKEIKKLPQKPAISNLLNIYSLVTNKTVPAIEREFEGKGYNKFKENLTEKLINFLKPFQSIKDSYYLHRRDYLTGILEDGKKKAGEIAQKTMRDVRKRVGLI
jgi:tryptophanyl-tRNA synthetase